jgi:hypothetical protein
MNSNRFFAELKRRNVYPAAALYRISAWLIAQITTQIFPFCNAPNSAVRFVIIRLALGFPNAMALAWNTQPLQRNRFFDAWHTVWD